LCSHGNYRSGTAGAVETGLRFPGVADNAGLFGVKGVIAAACYVDACEIPGTPLTDDNFAGRYGLAVLHFDAEPF